MKIHLKKILVSFFVIIGFVFYAVYQRNVNGLQNVVINTQDTNTTVNQSAVTTKTTTDKATSIASTNAANALYKDGQYDGNIADAYYGNVQVRAIIQGGKLTNVQFLSYPNDRNHSIQVNSYAMPMLKSEAIKAQSAQVDIVSGATNTSNAFINSLSSALSQAKM